ncbi:MAG: hypothetical protein HW388_1486 [Dehalococcoidia bacterium]|nr:hypothetical protein [Dehalococcoidia bacterium]
MKRDLSVRGILVAVLLLVVALSAGTALAERQGAPPSQQSLERKEGASIVTNKICLAPTPATTTPKAAAVPAALTVWGSGWAPKELILLSVIRDSDNVMIWYSGAVNAAGATEIAFSVLAPGTYSATELRPMAPAPGIYTLEALGTSGRLASSPIVFVAPGTKCP